MAQKTKKLSSSYEESEYKNEFVKSSKSDIENDTNSKDLKKQASHEKNFKDFGFKESILKSLEKKRIRQSYTYSTSCNTRINERKRSIRTGTNWYRENSSFCLANH